MIAKQIKGKDFYGVLMYNQKKIDNGFGSIIDTNLCLGSVVEQVKELNIVRQLRPNLSKAVYHTSLNLPYSDKLSDEEFGNLARDYLEEMGFNDNQFIIYKHTDQDHSHIHIVANRVKFSGEVVNDSQDFKRSESLIRKLEKKYQLSELIPNEISNILTQGEIEKSIRTGDVPDRLRLQYIINEILNERLSLKKFEEELIKKQVRIKLNIDSNNVISGISFEYKNITYKGSKVHRNLSWNNIKNIINYEQDRNDTAVHSISVRNGKVEQKTRITPTEPQGNGEENSGKSIQYNKESKDNLGRNQKKINRGLN